LKASQFCRILDKFSRRAKPIRELAIRITSFRINGVLLYLRFLHPNDLPAGDFLTTACNTLPNKPPPNETKFLNTIHMIFPTRTHYTAYWSLLRNLGTLPGESCRCVLDHAINNADSLCRPRRIVVLYHMWRSFFSYELRCRANDDSPSTFSVLRDFEWLFRFRPNYL
jgi:hypothetical protein